MKKMYRDCQLVHADLSEYNMLWDAHTSTLYFIDVSQAVDVMHPHAMEFLLRDCTNVVNVSLSLTRSRRLSSDPGFLCFLKMS